MHPNNLDFVPRLGAAYRVTPTFVVRGGFGIYAVDITHNAFADQYNQPPFIYKSGLSRSLLISQNVNVNSLLTFQNPTANGSSANASAALAAIGGFSDDYPTMKTYTANITVEKDLGHGMSVRATYTNNQARNLSRVVAGQCLCTRPRAVPFRAPPTIRPGESGPPSIPTSASRPPTGPRISIPAKSSSPSGLAAGSCLT